MRPRGALNNCKTHHKWVMTVKTDKHGKFQKVKARLVAKGFAQVHGVDFSEISSPVSGSTTLRCLLATAASRDWHIDQLGGVTSPQQLSGAGR